MATTLAGNVNLGLNFDYLSTGTGFDTLQGLLRYTNSPTAYTSGAGDNQVNAIYVSKARSLAATNESFDLNALTDIYGTTLNFTKVKLLFIKNLAHLVASPSGKTLTLTGDFLTQAGVGVAAGGKIVGPGGIEFWDNPLDGFTVTATTADVITVTNAATFTYDLIIMGVV